MYIHIVDWFSSNGPWIRSKLIAEDEITSLGNTIEQRRQLDSYNSNLVINLSDTYTNSGTEEQQVAIQDFSFYASRVADPITPFVVRIDGENNFTVLAVGKTRENYNNGGNRLLFDNGYTTTVILQPGETLAAGFLDAYADGSGGGIGSVIPHERGKKRDRLWYSGGPNGGDSGAIVVGQSPTPGSETYTELRRDYSYNIEFAVGETKIVLGNSIVSRRQLDSYSANMVINLSDTYTNTGSDKQSIALQEFSFYAEKLADPVTPFVVRIDGENSFTVLAVGTTQENYNIGANVVSFLAGETAMVVLNPGETLATGFIDANADGSGGGYGSVIPHKRGKKRDRLWYSGGLYGDDAGALEVGASPIPGSETYTSLYRDYSYSISLAW